MAILLVACGTCVGFVKANRLQRRVKELTSYAELLEWLQRNLQFRRLSTEKLLRTAWKEKRFAALTPLQLCVEGWNGDESFSTLWRRSVKKADLHLLPQEVSLLTLLGEILGAGTAEEQRGELTALLGMVTLQQQDAQQQVKQDGGLCRTLGVFGGLFAAVLIL